MITKGVPSYAGTRIWQSSEGKNLVNVQFGTQLGETDRRGRAEKGILGSLKKRPSLECNRYH